MLLTKIFVETMVSKAREEGKKDMLLGTMDIEGLGAPYCVTSNKQINALSICLSPYQMRE